MEARTLHCPSCGAGVGEQDLRCPYCDSQLATMACPHCFTLVSARASHCPACGTLMQAVASAVTNLTCPDCRVPLTSSVVGGLTLDQCTRCGGLWLDQKTFETIAADREERGEVLGSLPASAADVHGAVTVHYRPCPRCGKLMNRQNYAHISGVVLNLCKADGIWFERDELRQVLAFIEGGGLERSRTRELQSLEEARHQVATESLPMAGGAWAEGPITDDAGGHLLTGVVESLLHLFR